MIISSGSNVQLARRYLCIPSKFVFGERVEHVPVLRCEHAVLAARVSTDVYTDPDWTLHFTNRLV